MWRPQIVVKILRTDSLNFVDAPTLAFSSKGMPIGLFRSIQSATFHIDCFNSFLLFPFFPGRQMALAAPPPPPLTGRCAEGERGGKGKRGRKAQCAAAAAAVGLGWKAGWVGQRGRERTNGQRSGPKRGKERGEKGERE